MFETNSRYYRIATASMTTIDGRTIAYLRRRFSPQGGMLPLLVEVSVAQSDRLDLIAHRTLGDATQFWRVCDANNALSPFELSAEPGRTLRIPVPQAE